MCPLCPQCAGPGPISRHYALSAAPDTSKMGTFPSAPPLAPAKMWIQLLNTGIGISNERQLGGGTIYQGLEHLWRAAKIWKSFSPQSPVHCKDHQQLIYVCNLYLHSIILCQVGRDIPSLLQMSISRDTRHGHAEKQDEGLSPLTDTRIRLLFINPKLFLWYSSRGNMTQE